MEWLEFHLLWELVVFFFAEILAALTRGVWWEWCEVDFGDLSGMGTYNKKKFLVRLIHCEI